MAENKAISILSAISQQSLAHAANDSSTKVETTNRWSGLLFQVAQSNLLISPDTVVEVIGEIETMPIPASQPWFLGIANVRGQIVPITDFCFFLFGQKTTTDGKKIIVSRLSDNSLIGLLVSAVLGMQVFTYADRVNNLSKEYEFLSGMTVGGMSYEGDIVPILDVNHLASHSRFLRVATTIPAV